MYFDLQNVPFFNGAYLITSVNHSITPNHMTTNFQGVRQSKFISPPTDKIVAELNLDLNESSEIPKIEFRNFEFTNSLYTIGVLNPTEQFDFESNFTLEKFKLLGVTLSDEVIQNKISTFQSILTSNSATTNSQVTTFMAAVLSNSNNLTNTEMPWEVENIENFKDNSVLITYEELCDDIEGTVNKIIKKMPFLKGMRPNMITNAKGTGRLGGLKKVTSLKNKEEKTKYFKKNSELLEYFGYKIIE